MKETLERLLGGGYDNHILPFMWLHGENEATIREYMRAIHSAHIGAVCVESRPHPDFGGPTWWRDMDIILDEARSMDMKVWILDDSHFPTGYANGAVYNAPDEMRRQRLVYRTLPCPACGEIMRADMAQLREIPPFVPRNDMEKGDIERRPVRRCADDRLLGLVAVRRGGRWPDGIIDLSDQIGSPMLTFRVPEGEWTLYILHLTRNRGARQDYINLLDAKACQLQIDAVHEPFWRHYARDFGRTIAGFFSDEPELGNGHLYETGKPIWQMEDQAWSEEVQAELAARFGDKWVSRLPLLWDQDFDAEAAAETRLQYMDVVTRLVEKNFSRKLGDWCRRHGVRYIGHLIEDNNQHMRTGPSLGHYFRGLGGQDMSGIDVISGQLMPGGGTEPYWTFFHYALGQLAASAAAIDPGKQGNSMCEIFGAYGWREGVRLEKYQADHFMRLGINHYVPHAFSLRDYPDFDCPPHFYAGGHDPLFRHFGALMLYMNRVCTLLSAGRRAADVAVLYGAESDWMGRCMMPEEITGPLTCRQIGFDFIPADVFSEPERYKTDLSGGLRVNGRQYGALILPACDHLAPCVRAVLPKLRDQGVRVIDAGETPPADIPGRLIESGIEAPTFAPASPDLRASHFRGDIDVWMLVNEGETAWRGEALLPSTGPCCRYDAWNSAVYTVKAAQAEGGTRVTLDMPPLGSVILVFGRGFKAAPDPCELIGGTRIDLNEGWTRSVCRAIDYPRFGREEPVALPDRLAEDMPRFSGFVRYDRTLKLQSAPARAVLTVTEAHEGVEVFVNGASCGLQVSPPFRYDLSGRLRVGDNQIRIEVATTLENENAPEGAPGAPSGIDGLCFIDWADEA